MFVWVCVCANPPSPRTMMGSGRAKELCALRIVSLLLMDSPLMQGRLTLVPNFQLNLSLCFVTVLSLKPPQTQPTQSA